MTMSGSDKEETPGHNRKRELLIVAAALLVGAVLFLVVYFIWHYEGEHPSTDNALLQAHHVWIVPQVEGRIVEKHVHNNEQVDPGRLLFRIDQRPYREKLREAEADLVLLKHAILADGQAVESARAQVKEAEAALTIARQHYQRVKPLVEKGMIAEIKGIEYENVMIEAQGKLAEARAGLEHAILNLGEADVQEARLRKARGAIELARLRLEWSLVRAPADGYVTKFDLREGDIVEPGQRLFPFIESRAWWAQANFKETQIKRIRPGMAAEISVDMYPDRKFKGVVGSLSSGAAAAFSLLPPQNTTGNWVKVTQRVPVRVYLLDQDKDHPFRLGASCSVTVNTVAPLLSPDKLRETIRRMELGSPEPR